MFDATAKMKMLRVFTTATMLASSVTACTIGPNYRRPDIDVPPAWRLGATESAEISNVAGWDQFQDPVLSELVRTALVNNKDLKIATANVDQAFAQYGITRAAQFPQITAGASALRERTSANAGFPAGVTFNDFGVNLSASFELDVWGRLRRATESARASLLASAEGRGAVVLTVVTTVATGYIQLRALDRQLDIARYTSRSLGEAARLQRIRFEEGAIPQSDYQQAEAQYRDAAARVPELEREIARQENFISVLLGGNPGPIARGRDIDSLLFPMVPAGLPATLLERRPDIRQAEQQLIAANANIGVAKAAYFPSLTLSATGGYQSNSMANLLTLPNRFWSIGPALAQTLFDGGARRAQTDQAIAVYDQNVAIYRQTVLTGFQEVEDNLAALRILEQEAQVQDEAVQLARKSVELMTNQYKAGIVSYLDVITTQTTALNSELNAVNIQNRRLTASVLLIKALGGGWHADALPTAAATAGDK